MVLVFQYGSNMLSERINDTDRLCGDAKSLGLVYTAGKYDIAFTVLSKTNNCATADIIPSRKNKVYGVLYEIPDWLLSRETSGKRRSLDAIEGKLYKRRKIRIRMVNNPDQILTVWTYSVVSRKKGIKTSIDYAQYIIAGLHEHGAPENYIEHVKARIYKNNPDLILHL